MGYGFINDDIFQIPEEDRSPQMIAIYSYLCNRAGAGGECWVGHQNIMQHTGIKTKNTIIKYLKQMEKLNLIEIKKRQNKTNIYVVLAVKNRGVINTPGVIDTPSECNSYTEGVYSLHPGGVTNDTRTITDNNNNITITDNSSSREAKPHSYDTTTTTEIIERLNKKSGNQFKATPKILAQVKGLLEAGYTAKDVNLVVDTKVPQFLAEGKDYLVQPSKLFDVDRFDDYLQESLNGISQYQKANQPRKRVVHPEWEGKPKQQQQQLTPEEVAANEEAMRKLLNDQLKHLRAN